MFWNLNRVGPSLAGSALGWLFHLLNPRPEALEDAGNQTLIMVGPLKLWRTLCSSCEGGTGDGLNFVQVRRSDSSLDLVLFGCFHFQPSVTVTEVGLVSSSEHVKWLCWLSGVFQPTGLPLWQRWAVTPGCACFGRTGWLSAWPWLSKAPAVSATLRNVCWCELDLIIILWPGAVTPALLLTCSVPHLLDVMVAEGAGGRWMQKGFLWHSESPGIHSRPRKTLLPFRVPCWR